MAQALCFGWIDGIRKSLGEDSYVIRFSPRKPNSIWSAVNIRQAGELERQGFMRAAGLKAFHGRGEKRSKQYSFEREHVELNKVQQKQFCAHPRAWAFFQSQPPGYRKTAAWWVVSAKQETTRNKRLATLIVDSEAGERIALLRK